MSPRDRLEQLLADLFDGPADETRNWKISELLRDHPELQDVYLDHVQLHALLQWRGGQAAPRPAAETLPIPSRSGSAGASPSRWRRTLAAAAVLLIVGAGGLLVWQMQEAQAAPDLVERLVDWNLAMAQTRSQDERNRIYDERAATLKATLATAHLPHEDRELAETLFDNSTRLTKIDHPAAEADRFNDIADKLVARMDSATDETRIVQLANSCQRLAEVGVDANIQRAMDGDLDAASEEKLEYVILRDASRTKRLAAIMDRNPQPSRKAAIHKAMKSHHSHKGKKYIKKTK